MSSHFWQPLKHQNGTEIVNQLKFSKLYHYCIQSMYTYRISIIMEFCKDPFDLSFISSMESINNGLNKCQKEYMTDLIFFFKYCLTLST